MNISLVGMMGSGKTTIGRLLSHALENFVFADTDELIVKREKLSINEIFNIKGENYFRDLETQILKEVLESDGQIISTGGGIVKSDYNIMLLKEKSIVIYLRAESEELYKRVINNNERPLLNTDDVLSKIKTLLTERESLYLKAHIKIDTSNKNPDIIVNEILEKLSLYGKG